MPELLASYPRSGSTWLRFILCNLLYPDMEHDFDSVNKHIPTYESWGEMKGGIQTVEYYKTHSLSFAQRVIFLHRHIGDVLISEYHYKRKFHADPRIFEEFVIACDYGQEWRQHINHYFPCNKMISFEDLDSAYLLKNKLGLTHTEEQITAAIEKSSFAIMQKAEDKGFGIYESGDVNIKFIRNGKSGQWKELSEGLQHRIVEKNYIQLKALGYI